LGRPQPVLYVFLWATAFVPSRVLARGAPPLGILAIRFLLAGGILLAIAAALRLRIPRDGRPGCSCSCSAWVETPCTWE